MDMFSYVLGETAAESRMEEIVDNAKQEVLAELKAKGMILPKYDWQDKGFNDTLEAIVADWFERHPETIRGSGEFAKKYPNKVAAEEMLSKMSGMGRITPDEYVTLYREINNF
jgi:hypothetical protein